MINFAWFVGGFVCGIASLAVLFLIAIVVNPDYETRKEKCDK